MATKSKYVVVHPVRHDGKLHQRGKTIDLTKDEAARLASKGTIKKADVVIIRGATLPAATLAKLNIAELTEYATSQGLTLAAGLTKEAIIGQLGEAAIQAAAEDAQLGAEDVDGVDGALEPTELDAE